MDNTLPYNNHLTDLFSTGANYIFDPLLMIVVAALFTLGYRKWFVPTLVGLTYGIVAIYLAQGAKGPVPPISVMLVASVGAAYVQFVLLSGIFLLRAKMLGKGNY